MHHSECVPSYSSWNHNFTLLFSLHLSIRKRQANIQWISIARVRPRMGGQFSFISIFQHPIVPAEWFHGLCSTLPWHARRRFADCTILHVSLEKLICHHLRIYTWSEGIDISQHTSLIGPWFYQLWSNETFSAADYAAFNLTPKIRKCKLVAGGSVKIIHLRFGILKIVGLGAEIGVHNRKNRFALCNSWAEIWPQINNWIFLCQTKTKKFYTNRNEIRINNRQTLPFYTVSAYKLLLHEECILVKWSWCSTMGTKHADFF